MAKKTNEQRHRKMSVAWALRIGAVCSRQAVQDVGTVEEVHQHFLQHPVKRGNK